MSITPDDLRTIAYTLVDRHGAEALMLADLAIGEMRTLGDVPRTTAWEALKSVIDDALDGRIDRDTPLSLH